MMKRDMKLYSIHFHPQALSSFFNYRATTCSFAEIPTLDLWLEDVEAHSTGSFITEISVVRLDSNHGSNQK